jgi:hypothetical protein
MNVKEKSALIGPDSERPPPWKSSIYREPNWVALAWILGPVLFAAVAIYFSIR